MIVAGFGFRASAEVSSLRDALAATGAVPTLVATASGKEAHPALMALATELNVPVVGVSEEKMAEIRRQQEEERKKGPFWLPAISRTRRGDRGEGAEKM